jgi:hypothetical protein
MIRYSRVPAQKTPQTMTSVLDFSGEVIQLQANKLEDWEQNSKKWGRLEAGPTPSKALHGGEAAGESRHGAGRRPAAIPPIRESSPPIRESSADTREGSAEPPP